MPVYNKRSTLRTMIERVLGLPIEIELFHVDDGWREILDKLDKQHAQIRVFVQPPNMGNLLLEGRPFILRLHQLPAQGV